MYFLFFVCVPTFRKVVREGKENVGEDILFIARVTITTPAIFAFLRLSTSIVIENVKPTDSQGSNEPVIVHFPAVLRLLLRCSEPQIPFLYFIHQHILSSCSILFFHAKISAGDFSYLSLHCCRWISIFKFYIMTSIQMSGGMNSMVVILNQNFLNHHLY